ncbi:histidine kinase dimerization/phosphoacceptor domain -containing protein [Methanobacterium sp.]|uniref:PAS domain S-box protein n=1 Tax=Methanobacterium sp. TaxID=2164 RepID=UPI003C769EC4
MAYKVPIPHENRFKSLFDNVPIGIFRSSPEGKLYEANMKLVNILGYQSPEELILTVNQTDIRECIYVNKENRLKFIEEALKDDLWHSHEIKLYKKNFSIIVVELSFKAIKNTDGSVKYLEGFIKDITKHKEAEEHFRKEVERESFLLEFYKKAPQLTDKELYKSALDYAIDLTDSSIGFFHFISDDQKNIILDTWNDEAVKKCKTHQLTHYPIEQAGNWTSCIQAKGPVVYNDYMKSPNRKGFPEGHVPVKRFMSIPVFDEAKVKFVFGVGNKMEEYTDHDVIQIQSIANELYRIIKRRHGEQELEKSEMKFRAIFDNAEDMISLIDVNNETNIKYIEVNNAGINRLGYNREELLTMGPLDIDEGSKTRKNIEKLIKTGSAQFETIHVTKDGKRIAVEVNVQFIEYAGKQVALEISRDISKRKKAENDLKNSLKEKELLLMEIHHRVKNNLQVISSLLDIQANYVEDKEAINVLQESKNRVRSMAMIHGMLYQSHDLASINFSNYIKNLIQDLLHSYGANSDIKLIVDAKQVFLNIETAIPCGLILSELVSNSLKYAFPDDNGGEILISVNSYNDEFELIISDNGIGFPENLDFKDLNKSLGLRLVNSLVEQLDGSIELDKSEGTKFIIKFKELEYTKRF